jgi:hypothetical protein
MYGLLAILIIVAIGSAGAYFKVQQWIGEAKDAGREECRVAIETKNAEIRASADALKAESANHITDMVAAEDFGRSQTETRIIYRQAKGASDVSKYPVFQNPACVLPTDSLRNLNAARAGIRRDVPDDPAVSVRVDAAGPGPGAAAGSSAHPGQVSPAVPRADAAKGGDVRRPLSKDGR